MAGLDALGQVDGAEDVRDTGIGRERHDGAAAHLHRGSDRDETLAYEVRVASDREAGVLRQGVAGDLDLGVDHRALLDRDHASGTSERGLDVRAAFVRTLDRVTHRGCVGVWDGVGRRVRGTSVRSQVVPRGRARVVSGSVRRRPAARHRVARLLWQATGQGHQQHARHAGRCSHASSE